MKKAFLAAAMAMCLFTSSVMADGFDYAAVQSASLYLYDANMCGIDVAENSMEKWRGNCHTEDVTVPLDTVNTDLSQDFINQYKTVLDSDGDGKVNVSGGYHDAGDYVKFGLPQMYSAVTLQWAFYEFGDSFKNNNDTEHFGKILIRFSEYI